MFCGRLVIVQYPNSGLRDTDLNMERLKMHIHGALRSSRYENMEMDENDYERENDKGRKTWLEI